MVVDMMEWQSVEFECLTGQMKISNFKWFTARGELENWRKERALATNGKGLYLKDIVVCTV